MEFLIHIGAIGILKYDYSGLLKWKTFLGYTSTALSTESVKLDENFNIYLGGAKDPLGPTPYQMLTIKYSQLIGINIISKKLPNNFKLSQNYPNPFNPNTKIQFAIPQNGIVSLKVYDILGREVKTLVNQSLKAGTYEINWDAATYSSGIYFYRLESENYYEAKKMILIK